MDLNLKSDDAIKDEEKTQKFEGRQDKMSSKNENANPHNTLVFYIPNSKKICEIVDFHNHVFTGFYEPEEKGWCVFSSFGERDKRRFVDLTSVKKWRYYDEDTGFQEVECHLEM